MSELHDDEFMIIRIRDRAKIIPRLFLTKHGFASSPVGAEEENGEIAFARATATNARFALADSFQDSQLCEEDGGKVKILVIGDSMVDEYWRGSVSRFSPVAPVPVVSVRTIGLAAGGAANVAANIEAMGSSVEHIFGGGERIRKITVTAGQHIARLDFDPPQTPIEPDAAFLAAVARCDMIVAIDYGKGSLANIQALIQAANGKLFLVDPKGRDYAKYRGATLIKPNRDEMRAFVGGWSTQAELNAKVRQFMRAAGITSVLLTQAEDGMTLYNPEPLHIESENQAPVDVSGAGEAALSAFAVAFAKGHILKECLRYASRAAGLAIARPGTVVLTEEEVFGTS